MEEEAGENWEWSELCLGYLVQGHISSCPQLIMLPCICCSCTDFGFVEKRTGKMGAALCYTSTTALLEHARCPRVTDPLMDSACLTSCSNLQASIISPRTLGNRQEALDKSEGQEKGMAKRRACKGWKHGFWAMTQDVEMQYIDTHRKKCLELSTALSAYPFPRWLMSAYLPYLQTKGTTETGPPSPTSPPPPPPPFLFLNSGGGGDQQYTEKKGGSVNRDCRNEGKLWTLS